MGGEKQKVKMQRKDYMDISDTKLEAKLPYIENESSLDHSEESMDSEYNLKIFKCRKCQSTFSNKGNLKRHVVTKHDVKEEVKKQRKDQIEISDTKLEAGLMTL